MFFRIAVVACALLGPAAAAAQDTQNQPFAQFLTELWPDVQAKGVTRATFDSAFTGLSPDQRVIAATKRQPEYGRPFGDYVNAVVNANRIAEGRRKAEQWSKTFDTVEMQFRVERWVLLAIWGLESSYGAAKDKWDVFRSLATLGYVRYRHPYFRNELIVALKLMQDDRIPRNKMVSSWAGAMGQSQFMPSNVIDYGIDFSGDGKRDLWENVPDVLGSTGNYLKKDNWQHGVPWGFEVLVPEGFDYKKSRATFPEWTRLGVRRADGKGFPPQGDGIIFFPSGAKGPAFVVTKNFDVIKLYNNSDAYAVAIGHLADRMAGGPPIKKPWPADDHQLSRDARVALQRKLAALGYSVKKFEGHIDFDLRDYIRTEQAKLGMVPDGTPTPALLEKLGLTITR